MIVKIKCINCGEHLMTVRVQDENRRKATKFKRNHIEKMKSVGCTLLHEYYYNLNRQIFLE